MIYLLLIGQPVLLPNVTAVTYPPRYKSMLKPFVTDYCNPSTYLSNENGLDCFVIAAKWMVKVSLQIITTVDEWTALYLIIFTVDVIED